MSAKYKSPSFLLPNELNTSANTANDTGINSLYSMDFGTAANNGIYCGPVPTMFIGDSSVSIWFKSEVANSNNVIFNRHTAGTGNFNDTYVIRTEISGSGVKIKLELGNPLKSFYSQNVYSKSVWHHLAVTLSYSSGQYTVKFYVDGVEDSPTNSPMTMPTMSSNSTLPLTIGALRSGSNFIQGCRGELDEVAIFNRALDSTEISALYGGTSPNIYPSNLMATDLNPVAYYPLGEQAQNTGYLDPNNPGSDMSGSEWQFPNGVLQDYVMDFDGSDNINSEANISSASSFTASVWINRDDSNTQYIYGQWVDGTSASQSWVIQTVGGIVYFNVRDASLAAKSAISTTSLTTGVWYNIIAVWTGSNIKLYINNSLEDTTACASMNNPSTAVKLAIGSSSNNVSPFNGKISNAVIWSSDQSTNIANIYNNGSPQTSYTVSPQNWWKLNADSVYTPSAPNYTTALSFDGTGDYIDVTPSSTLAPNTGDFTFSGWFYRDSSSIGTPVYFEKGAAYPGNGILVRDSAATGLIEVYYNAFGPIQFSNLTSYNTSNAWHHIALVYNESGNTLTAYVDGNSEQKSATTTLNVTDSIFIIGKRQNDTSYWLGKISNNAIFNSALTSSQISTLFNFGTPETNISFNPQAWWKLDDQTAITDSSGNGNTGTNNGATDISSGVAVTPSWKIPNALPVPTINTTSALDFSSGKIDISPTIDLDITTTNTISFWINLTSNTSQNYILSNNGTGTGAQRLTALAYVNIGASNAETAIYSFKEGYSTKSQNEGWRSTAVANSDFSGSWHHVAIVRGIQNISYYYDGQPLGTGTLPAQSTATQLFVDCIGAGMTGSGTLNAKLSNLAIWKSDQSTNISNIYNNGQPQSSYTVTPDHLFKLDNLTTGINDVYSSSAGTATSGVTKVDTNVYVGNIPVNGVSTTLPSTALQQSDLQFDSPYSNYSLSFDGANNFIDCGANKNILDFSGNDYTVSTWVNWDGTGSANQMIASVKSGGSNVDFVLSIQQSTGKIIYWNGSTQVFSNSAIPTNAWCMVTIIVKATQKDFFINGVADGTPLQTRVAAAASGTNFLIGKSSYGSEFFKGKIDETSIFNYNLSQAQILEIYNNGRPKDLTTFSGTAPISWWRLGENAYFDNNSFIVPNSISGAPNGTGSGTITTMISADAPGTYANGIGTNLDILDRVGDAALSTSNSQSYNMIPSDINPYVPQYVGKQIANNFSMTFDGVDDYFDAGNNTSLQITGNLTISMWFKTTATTGYLISDTPAIGGCYSVLMGGGNGQLWARRGNGTNAETTQKTSNAYNDGNWHNIVFVSDSTMRIYIDGVLDVQSTVSTPSSIGGTTTVKIGDGFANFAGQIDEVAIFDTALNAGQIYNDIYNASLPLSSNKTADLVNNPNLPNPVAWYRMGD